MSRPEVMTTGAMLRQEFGRIRPGAVGPEEDPRDAAARLHLSALCLSGGGIRSAAFCLGVLQALAEAGLLRHFDYLSTVSGGGFIGGWLQMLVQEKGSVAKAEEELKAQAPPALHRLRGFTNYLAPQTGPLSVDAWTGVVLYLRNLGLNWAIFLPLFLLLGLATIFYRTALWQFGRIPWSGWAALVVASVVLAVGVICACWALPSHREREGGKVRAYAGPDTIKWAVVTPALAWAGLLPFAWQHWLAASVVPCPTGPQVQEAPCLMVAPAQVQMAIPVAYALALLAGYGVAWGWSLYRAEPGKRLFARNILPWLGATFVPAALLWVGLRLAPLVLKPGDTAIGLAILAPPLFAIAHLIQTAVYVGLRREGLLADLDREWLARVSASILRTAFIWMLFALCCLGLTDLVFLPVDEMPARHAIWPAGLGALASGSLAAWIGKQAFAMVQPAAGDAAKSLLRKYLTLAMALNLLSLLFIALLFTTLGWTLQTVLGLVQLHLQWRWDWAAAGWLPLALQLGLLLVFLLSVWAFSHVNVNRFSMHGVYRNRLARAFLGSARDERTADPFTGFDEPGDNPRLHSLMPECGERKLFPVINMTLNITAGSNTAWAERKAASFTATPLACGSAVLDRGCRRNLKARAPRVAADAPGAFVPTSGFGGMDASADRLGRREGITLGSALTISGAAVSPNWGYHSSRLPAFLMTLFNVRLGAWLPNPAVATERELHFAMPRNAMQALVAELLGRTTDTTQAIYLSDGGHFENLALYEMLRRRCLRIVVIDAGQDGECTFFDLGNAIRKAEIDLEAHVHMSRMRIFSRHAIGKGGAKKPLGVAVGSVTYRGGDVGSIVYLKPSFLPGIPEEVRAYGLSDLTFPHDNTIEQWFTESQFESYRALGAFQMRQVTAAMTGPDFDQLFDAAKCLSSGSAA